MNVIKIWKIYHIVYALFVKKKVICLKIVKNQKMAFFIKVVDVISVVQTNIKNSNALKDKIIKIFMNLNFN